VRAEVEHLVFHALWVRLLPTLAPLLPLAAAPSVRFATFAVAVGLNQG
jgi:hypothetical protein